MSDDLFSSKKINEKSSLSPLADRMRPRTLEDIIGQDHIVGQGRLLRRAIQADRLSSIILYGPPGTGKTSLAAVIANTTRAAFENLNAVLSGVKDIREVIDRADERYRLYGKRTILFVDEVHRWNKAQQDALLPWVENGTVILIGATTENPFFEVNRALVSRSRIFQLKPFDKEGLTETALRAINDKERGYGNYDIKFEEGALEHLVEVAGGDARSLLNALELAVETSNWTNNTEKELTTNLTNDTNQNYNNEQQLREVSVVRGKNIDSSWPPPEGCKIFISIEAAEESIQRRALLYDRDGDYHFDTISAFIKSIRGSDPDAALYWLAKMVRAGEDPKFIFRRMIILASEDVGLADPHAVTVVISCAQAFERIGFPEGNFPLSHACLYLATAPKSNTTLAYFDALKEVEKEDADVPNHLRDGSRDAEGFGHGNGYIYPHAYRDHWAAQQYLPNSLKGRTFYNPSAVGYEGKIRDDVLLKRELQAAVILGNDNEDSGFITWSASAKGREGWYKRLESGRSALLLRDRELIFKAASLERHARVLIPNANDGLLIWESLRRCPEGLTAALVTNKDAKDTLLSYASISSLDEIEKPEIAVASEFLPFSKEQCENFFSCSEFDHILIRCHKLTVDLEDLASAAKNLISDKGCLTLLSSPPRQGMRISSILIEECFGIDKNLTEILEQAEEDFFESTRGIGLWDADSLSGVFEKYGYKVNIQEIEQKEERLITEKDIETWFNAEKSRWGAFIAERMEEAEFLAVKDALNARIKKGPVSWKWKSILLSAIR